MQPRDRLTAKEIQVATLVWQGLTNKDIAGVLTTSEQVVKNYLRTAFDKLGVWTRLELALYVASHGGANWHAQLGNGRLDPARTRALRRQPRRSELACATGEWAVVTGGGVERIRKRGTSVFGEQRKVLRERRAAVGAEGTDHSIFRTRLRTR